MLKGIRHTAILILALVMVALVGACGGTQPLPNVDVTVEATAQVVVEATALSVPTVTPVRTATSIPTAASKPARPTLTPAEDGRDEVVTCTLSGGEIVQKGWSGKDTGSNYCNQCRCMDAGLTCTEMACGESKPVSTRVQVATSIPTQMASKIEFGQGIYYRQPYLYEYGALLRNVEGLPLPTIEVMAFDIRPEAVVYAVDDKLILVASDGNINSIKISGLHQMDRPSFSPDGTKVAVQARETYTEPEDLNVYIVDLNTGKSERVSHLAVNEESPEWFSNKNKIAYTSFDPISGLTAHIYDVDAGREIQAIKGAGYIHLTVSPDGTLIFNPVLSRLYDVETGKVVADLKDKVLEALRDNGYAPDTRFHGQANLGTFPMDADFSPDGNHIVFDGAVEKNGKYGLIIFTMTTSGDNITPLTDIIEVNPTLSNDNNYSQLNPSWR